MTYIVGAYITSPVLFRGWDPDIETALYDGLADLELVGGLELPWVSSLHPQDDAWLERNLRPEWDLVVTGIIGTAFAQRDDPSFGLASADESGRSSALRFAEGIAAGIARLNDIQGRQAVRAVELHSAPHRHKHDSSTDAFIRSLGELAGLDWHGAEVLIEHADALRDTTPQKGFLELADEIAAVQRLADPRFGIALNWGRSVIETRDADAVVDHVVASREAGLLRAFTYSGTAAVDNSIGVAWQDSHLGIATTISGEFQSEQSLLTQDQVARIATALPADLAFTGLKLAWPSGELDPAIRVGVIDAQLRTLDSVTSSVVSSADLDKGVINGAAR